MTKDGALHKLRRLNRYPTAQVEVPTEAGAVSLAINVIQNPRTSSVIILIALNMVLLGFGFWWNAWALQVFAAVVSTCLAIAWLNEKCFGFGPIFTTIMWIVPPVCGAIAVRAYRCMRNCDGASYPPPSDSTCSDCPDVDVGAFSWDPSIPFWLSWLGDTVQWVVDIVNFIPEGICWLNMALGFFFLVLSIFYWDWGGVFGTIAGAGRSPRKRYTIADIPLMALSSVVPANEGA